MPDTALDDIEAGEGTFLIVERTTDATGHTYAQSLRRDDGSYTLEHREGDADHHYRTVAPHMSAVTDEAQSRASDVAGHAQEAGTRVAGQASPGGS